MARKMRFNQKELAYIACKNDIPSDKEGILWLKEKEGYFIKNEVYTERWFRLRGNILFYFKTKDKTSEPAGAIVLERCKVTRQPTQSMKHAFNITFDEDDSQQYHLCGKSSKETDEWMEKITNASYEGLRNKLSTLRKQLMDITGKDPLPDSHPLAQQEPLKPGIGEYSSSSTIANPDETPLLEMCIACNGLSCIEGRLPNAFVEIRTMTPPSGSWTKHAQTEIIEKKSDPYFLTTVVFPSNGTIQDVTRLKLAVFDVVDREKEEMSILGQAVCTIKDIISAPDQKLTLTLTCVDSSAPCGTVVILGWQGEADTRQRSLSEDSVESMEGGLGARRNSGKSMRYIDQILTRSYRFPTTEPGRVLKVLELMGESTLAFKIPIQLLKIYIAEEHQRALELHHLGDLNPDWENARHAIIENHFKLIFIYKNFLRDLVPLQGNTFKASKHKGHKQLPFIPVNLHLQRLRVHDGLSEGKAYDVITVGAPVCHTLKFSQGGLRKMMLQLKKEQHIEPESETKAALLKQSRATLERLKFLISQLCERLKKSMKSLAIQNILDSLANLSDKTNHLLKLREIPLVTESLSSLEKVVPRPRDDEQGAESSEWQWNVTAFSKDKAQELSKLVQQTLFVMQTHVTGMIQGAKPPEGQQWIDVILGEIHDVSRATDGLAKEIYLGLVFAQLQEDSRHAMLRYSIKRRHDIVFAHAVTSLVAGFISKLYINLENQQFWRQMLEIGFLAQFESLLSTNGDEMGMLEDMCVAVQSLTRVKFKIRNCERDDEIPAVSGNRLSITVTIPVQEESFHLLPKHVQEGRVIKVIPVLFSQGVNEHATLAEKFGDTSLQEYINGDNYSILSFYAQQFKDKFPELCVSRRKDDPTLDNLMEHLKVDVESRKNKNIDILLHSEEICWRMNGARFTSCKSAKDRTAMSVCLEQALILQREHNMDPNFFQQSIDAMRSNGTRIENTKKNTGVRKYAFNYWQVMALPRMYRPPPGTYGKNDS